MLAERWFDLRASTAARDWARGWRSSYHRTANPKLREMSMQVRGQVSRPSWRLLLVIAVVLAAVALSIGSPPRAAAASAAFVQVNSATPQTSQSSVSVAYSQAQGGGDLNVVVVGFNDATSTISLYQR